MSRSTELPIGEFFEAKSGRAIFIRDYFKVHSGEFPVYSASLGAPFGFVNTYDYEGTYLSWVMNGYGGRVHEISGCFSATRDRGVFVPRPAVNLPDLTYLRFAMEPQLVAAAVGRRVDGRLNEYTKIYPSTAENVFISLPVTPGGKLDYARMAEVGDRLRRIEAAQHNVEKARDALARATFAFDVPEPSKAIFLGDATVFSLSIGERVLRTEHSDVGVPVYSANVLVPFGKVKKSNLSNFKQPSLLWGIDGNFEWNLVPAGHEFATTDHCGRLLVVDENIDPQYVFAYLKATRAGYGFDRVFRASLANMRAEVSVVVPLGQNAVPSLDRQRKLAMEAAARERAQAAALAALDDMLKARMAAEV